MPVQSIFTDEENELIRTFYPDLSVSIEELADMLGVTPKSVTNRAGKMGVRRKPLIHPSSENVPVGAKQCRCDVHRAIDIAASKAWHEANRDIAIAAASLTFKARQAETIPVAVHYGQEWTSRQDDELLKLYQGGMPLKDIAKQLGRSYAAIVAHLDKVGR